MAAALRGAMFVGLLLCAAGRVPRPRNARITSVNLQSTLQWDAPRVPKGNITYTVRSKSVHFPGEAYDTVWSGLSATRCDVSSLPAYGHYQLQVRAELGPQHSPWVTLRFRPLDH
ncbi:interleukin-10 receptor subunit beta-like, partial [Empidonax traillii]|uniref:interleukin-10 receptor subunit beta-like n=1 Tax=Empidonax traillii TaxID=164674 RepID=UPI000FFD0991